MSQVMGRRGRAGWSQDETRYLWETLKASGAEGAPLKNVFDAVAEHTGRKPNSVRNYYYAAIKTEDAPKDIVNLRALPFTPFDDDEVEGLVRSVLKSKSQGVSVRACVMSMAGGDRSRMLRYQNKYRAVLRSQPEMIERIVEELRAEGVPCINPCAPMTPRANADHGHIDDIEPLCQSVMDDLRMIGDEEAAQALEGIKVLTRIAAQRMAGRRRVEENDRQNVRINLLRLELMRRDEALMEARSREASIYDAMKPIVQTACALLDGEDGIRPDTLAEALPAAQGAMEELYSSLFAPGGMQ